MVDDRLPERFPSAGAESGQEADAVLGGVLRWAHLENIGAGGEEIGETDQLIGPGAGLHPPGPADQERDVMAALEDVCLVAAERVVRVMPLRLEFLELGRGGTTVVAGTGSSATGGNYNFGVAGTNGIGDRALGSLASASTQRDTEVDFTNNLGFNITSMVARLFASSHSFSC